MYDFSIASLLYIRVYGVCDMVCNADAECLNLMHVCCCLMVQFGCFSCINCCRMECPCVSTFGNIACPLSATTCF